MEVRQLDLSTLSDLQARQVRALIPLEWLLTFKEKNKNLVAFAAFENDEPVAFSLGLWLEAIQRCSLFFLSGKSDFFPDLLIFITQTAKKAGLQVVSLSHEEGDVAIEAALEAAGWTKSRRCYFKCLVDTHMKVLPKWFSEKRRYPLGMQEFHWKKLRESERESLHMDLSQGRIPETISPFHREDLLEPMNSLGVRFKGEVMAWSICHRVAPDRIRHVAFYVRPPFRQELYAVKPMVESLMLQRKSPIRWAEFIVNNDTTERTWESFVKKRMIPFVDKVIYIRESWIDFSQE